VANRFEQTPEGIIEWLDDDEDLWRQVPLACMTGSEPNSTAFNPSKDHKFALSVARERLTARGAFEQYTRQRENGVTLSSEGTWAIKVSLCKLQELHPFDDSQLPGLDDGHVSVPFDGTASRGSRKVKAQALCEYAVQRGCEYRRPGWTPPME
jgi:hypothetical protein